MSKTPFSEDEVVRVLKQILLCLPSRSDWSDDVKVTFEMGIEEVRFIIIDYIKAYGNK